MLKSLPFACLLLFGLLELGLAYNCGKIFENRVSQADTNLIVQIHNDLRKSIANGKVPGQPRGVNLKRLKYDSGLARAAQKIADSCIFAHQTVHDGRFAVGQNLFMTLSSAPATGANWTTVVEGWFNEYKFYKYAKCCVGGEKTGHYTQVVWANTEYVGCGYTYYRANSISSFNQLYVCNYGPAGNYIGQLPYEIGTSGCENLC